MTKRNKYRGKYPNRIKSVSYSRASGWHVETNRGDWFKFTSHADQAAIVAAYPLRGIECGMDIFEVLASMATFESEQPATLPAAYDESLSNDSQAATMNGRQDAMPLGNPYGDVPEQAATEQPLDDINAALIGWNRAKRNGDTQGLIESGDVLAAFLAGVREGESI